MHGAGRLVILKQCIDENYSCQRQYRALSPPSKFQYHLFGGNVQYAIVPTNFADVTNVTIHTAALRRHNLQNPV